MQEYKIFNKKLLIIAGGFLLAFTIIIARLFYIQLLCDEDCIKNIAKNIPYEVYQIISVPQYRGAVKDAKGTILALSVPSISVYARPRACSKVDKKDAERFIAEFSRMTGISKRKLRRIIYSGETHRWIVRGLHKNKEKLKERLIKLLEETGMSICIGYIDDFRRIYPYENIAANLIGHVNADGKGAEGIELLFDDFLKGGLKSVYISYSKSLGRFVTHPVIDTGSFLDVRDVYLTINLSAQKVAEDIKNEIVKEWKPKKVSIVVMDINTGEIIAMANYPTYNPNRYKRYKASFKKNIAVTDLFEPGSTMKPFFISYALEKGYVNDGMIIDTKNGVTEVYGKKVRDPKRLGKISLREVIIHSSNVGSIEVAKRLSKKDAESIIERFHLNETFGTLIGEAKPKIPNFSQPANILYASIGQGLSFNVLNLTVAFGALATGNIVKPQILKKVVDSKENVIFEGEREIIRKNVLKPETRKWILETLIDVVEKGTGRRAKSEYFTIAGKTGTAQKFDVSKGRYSRERVTTFFVGIFPATNPRFVASIMVDEPKGRNVYGGTVCAPYFKRLVEEIAFFFKIEPDKKRN